MSALKKWRDTLIEEINKFDISLFVILVKTFHLLMDYIPLYGDKTPSVYVWIDLIIAESCCLTILHLLVKN